jgi:DNA polymerase III epsilon subunit-like protein
VFLIVDCETNGLPRNFRAPVTDLANWPRAIQIAWAFHDESHQLCTSATRIVRPEGFQIPPDAVRVHGISMERALNEGHPIADVLAELSQMANDAKVVVAHNAGFDGSVIAAEYVRLGLEPPFVPSSMICTMTQSTDHCRLSGPYGNKWPELDELHMFLFGTLLGGAHDAGVDVAACARCFFELVGRGVISIR